MNEPLNLSVVIIASNEEANLGRCLKSLPPNIEIIVLDSGSTDRTVAIAESFGARVFQRPFTHFADHKNAAVSHATRRWVLAIDADEELNPELKNAVTHIVLASSLEGPSLPLPSPPLASPLLPSPLLPSPLLPSPLLPSRPANEVRVGRPPEPATIQAYRIQRRLVFMGRRMRFGKTRDWPVRLFLREAGHYEGSIHEELKVPGVVAKLPQGLLWHYSYKDLSDYFVRFNRYTTAIAERHIQEGKKVGLPGHLLRPWLEFFTRYVLRLGFLDGYPGYTYALISSLYAYIKYAKILEKGREHD